MFELAIWNFKARLYQWFRNRFPFAFIIRREQQAVEMLLQQIPRPVQTVVDLGTGLGDALSLLKQATCRIGLDQSVAMLKVARRKNGDASFIAGDACGTPFHDHTTDLVFAIGLFEYMADPATLFQEISRILSPNGHALVSISPRSLWTALRKLHGLPLYPMNLSEFQVIAEHYSFEISNSRKTMMQQQVLLRKRERSEA